MILRTPKETLEEIIGLVYEVDIDAEEIRQLTGTDNLRIYSTEMGVTMDFDMTRINVIYDAETKKILEITNG